MKIQFLLLVALLTLNMKAFAQDKNFYVFLSFGQSNMEGVPGLEEQDKAPVDERFKMLAAVDFPNQNREKGVGIQRFRRWRVLAPALARPTIWPHPGGQPSGQHQGRRHQSCPLRDLDDGNARFCT